MSIMPALFIGHGSPINALENNRWSNAWTEIGQSLPRPKAILSISAHWQTPHQKAFISSQEANRTIHDFYGFPKPLYEIEYVPPISKELTLRSHSLLPESRLNSEWGIDHGTWSVLRWLFPDADIPVVQLSLDLAQDFSWHYDLAKKLASLRSEGILLFGSGNIVHNLRRIAWDKEYFGFDWAQRFDQKIKKALDSGDHNTVVAPFTDDPDALLSIPTPDHYLPLLYVLAAQDPNDRISYPVEGFSLGGLSMRSVLFAPLSSV